MSGSLPQQSPIVQDPANREQLSPFEKDQLQFHIEKFGHVGIYKHECPMCERSWDCKSSPCHKPRRDFCKECTTGEFISDVKRLCEIVRSHMRLSYDPVVSTHMGYLEGLVKRAAELEVWVDE